MKQYSAKRRERFYSRICKPVIPTQKPAWLYTKDYVLHEITIAIRILMPDKDLFTVCNWLAEDNGIPCEPNSNLFRYHADCFQSMLQSSITQPFMAFANHQPVAQLDITSFPDSMIPDFIFEQGDFLTTLRVYSKKPQLHKMLVLQSFLELFFVYPENKRIFIQESIEDVSTTKLLLKAGFELVHLSGAESPPIGLYACTSGSRSHVSFF